MPVIEDGGRFVADSWAIAEYLDESYPDRPSLFGGANGHGLARFIDNWTTALMGEDDSVHAWFERWLDLHGGIGRAEPAKTA